jgi:class 3 adenylate cyclase
MPAIDFALHPLKIFNITARTIFPSRVSNLREFPLKTYSLNFSLDRLCPGVDNIRYDVHLSPGFCEAAAKIVSQLVARHCKVEKMLDMDRASWVREKHDFKHLCRHVMIDGIHKSKIDSEIQIDFLSQIAIVKMLEKEIRDQFDILIGRVKNHLRQQETSRLNDTREALKTKGKLSSILQNKESIIRSVGNELFQYLTDVQSKHLKEMREANFGIESLLPDDVLSNPMFHTVNPYNQFFMIEEYDVVFGRRVEDPDNHNTLMSIIKGLLNDIDRQGTVKQKVSAGKIAGYRDETRRLEIQDARTQEIDSLIRHVDNIDILINCYQSKDRYSVLKKQKRDNKDLQSLKRLTKNQGKLLSLFYRQFKQAGLIKRIVASFEMRPICFDYCPPLVPLEILEFLISPKKRKVISSRLKRLRRFYNNAFSLIPLRKKIRTLARITPKERKHHLIRFINGFARYHRDLQNYTSIKEAMECVNLTAEEKVVSLSRANNTLYEFLLPNEQVLDEKPIMNHAVLKADVRGSTHITQQMNSRGLNPASYLYLNFFAPISQILPEYGAIKVFVEGDAIILSVFERENTIDGCYTVARACGLAMRMLMIIKKYNAKSRKHKLPILELGIGISYDDSAPTFLFDGENRIMISSAINVADRLSGCSKSIRKIMTEKDRPFNLYVFQTEPEKDMASTGDDGFDRYNVNGIELNATGFKKLSQEIDLKATQRIMPDLGKEKIKLYTGKFPTAMRKFQRLVIREAQIPRVSPDDLKVVGITPRKYYEVCTNPKLYKYVREICRVSPLRDLPDDRWGKHDIVSNK